MVLTGNYRAAPQLPSGGGLRGWCRWVCNRPGRGPTSFAGWLRGERGWRRGGLGKYGFYRMVSRVKGQKVQGKSAGHAVKRCRVGAGWVQGG